MSGHKSVLLDECVATLAPRSGGLYLDCTFGGGGHSRAILSAASRVRLTAFDADPEAGPRAAAVKAEYGDNFRFIDGNFEALERAGTGYDGILMDLGVSSFQLDDAARGFSFRNDAPADMRLDPRKGISAADFLETADERDLVKAVRDFGEEQAWKRVVRAIIAARGTGKLSRTASLAALVESAIPRKPGPPARIHPATLTFQGIRIFVNDEIGVIERALPKAFAALSPGGVLAVISFHSLEDRPVKRYFNEICGRPVDSNDSRNQDERIRLADLVTRKPVTPSDAECSANPRSRSAKLRGVRKL
jgi:16S rRNA (cytosine1402-N4)-methyltransferase